MFQLPPIPSWAGLHPLMIHFPIALLLVAPLFIVAGAILSPRKSRPAMMAALLLMVLGTVSIFVAVESGEAAGRIAERGADYAWTYGHCARPRHGSKIDQGFANECAGCDAARRGFSRGWFGHRWQRRFCLDLEPAAPKT
jgi:hypothetical protein